MRSLQRGGRRNETIKRRRKRSARISANEIFPTASCSFLSPAIFVRNRRECSPPSLQRHGTNVNEKREERDAWSACGTDSPRRFYAPFKEGIVERACLALETTLSTTTHSPISYRKRRSHMIADTSFSMRLFCRARSLHKSHPYLPSKKASDKSVHVSLLPRFGPRPPSSSCAVCPSLQTHMNGYAFFLVVAAGSGDGVLVAEPGAAAAFRMDVAVDDDDDADGYVSCGTAFASRPTAPRPARDAGSAEDDDGVAIEAIANGCRGSPLLMGYNTSARYWQQRRFSWSLLLFRCSCTDSRKLLHSSTDGGRDGLLRSP